jgi:ligand-binding sensor protein
MRLTIFFLTLLVLSVSANNTTDSANSGSTACSDCWKAQRDAIDNCQNIPSTEMADFAVLTDDALAANVTKYPTLVGCLCSLTNSVNTIISNCPSCNGDIGQGLVSEASIVSKVMCGQVVTSNSNSTSSDNGKDSKKSNGSSSGDSSSNNDDGSQTQSDSTASQTTGTSDATVSAQANDAISIAPWSKSIFSLIVALVAAWLHAF